MKVNKNRKNNKKIALLALVAAIVVVGVTAYGVLAYQKSMWPFTGAELSDQSDDSVNYGPPTQNEVEHSQDAKKDAYENKDDSDTQGNSSSKMQVEVGVAFADIIDGSLEVRAFTPSVVEGDGTCTVTAIKGASTVTGTSKAFIDSTTSQCQPIKIPVSSLSSGTWQVSVDYSSSKSFGKSEIIEVRVP